MLIEANLLLLFIPAALALNLTPGADMLFCLGQGLRCGAKAGLAASFGIATGSLIHTLLAAAGLAAVLKAHPAAFEFIRWAGVGYLLWLALQAFRQPVAALQPTGVESGGALRAWRDGIVVNLLNPKIAVFVLAFLPQFVDPSKGSPFLQFLILGTIFNIGGTVVNGLIGGFAGGIGRLLATSPRVAAAFRLASGTIFLALAARLAVDSK